MSKTKTIKIKSLKQGQVVRIRKHNGSWLRGEYLVESRKVEAATPGRGGMDEGSPQTWYVSLRRLNDDGTYNPNKSVKKVNWSEWCNETSNFDYEVVGRMEQNWLRVE